MTVSPIEMKLHCIGGLTRTIAVASRSGEGELDVDVGLARLVGHGLLSVRPNLTLDYS